MTASSVTVQAADGGAFTAYLATPSVVTEGHGVVVVLQEIFGVNANIRSIADDFAAAGLFAVAPDLFWRQEPGVELNPGSPDDRERATVLMKGMDVDLAVKDAEAALAYARAQPGATGRSGAVGFCLGGKIAYLLAARAPLDVAVSYYGVGIQGVLDEVTGIAGQLLLHIAGEDHLCPPEAQAKIAEAVSVLGDRATVITYPGVGHAFARRGGSGFDAAAAEKADRATLAALSGDAASA